MPANIALTDRQILVDGHPDLVIGGEFQYFRVDPARWEPALRAVKEAGFTVVSAYVPWIWHEPVEGQVDLTGTTHPGRNLVLFLALCADLGLSMVIKPGPFIYAEYQGFGVPLWLATNHPDWLMDVHKKQVFPQPALNHPGYLAAVRGWFAAVAQVMAPHLASGRVIAIQIDNETGYPQFGQGPHLTDLNPATLVLLRASLQDRFGSVEALNRAWETDFASFDVVVPPEERRYKPAMIDTMARHVEDYIVHYLEQLAGFWREITPGVPLFLNDIFLDSWPSHLGKKNAVAPVAYDIYPRYSDLPVVFDQPYCISFVPRLFAAFLRGGPLLAAELGAGWLDPACTVSSEATWLSSMAAIAHGTRGLFYYTLIDGRDPDGDYVFSPFWDIEGRPLPRLEVARRVTAFSASWGAKVAQTRAINSSVAILHHPAITREMMSAALDPLGTALKGSQRAMDEAMTIVSVNAGLFGALAEAGYHPDVRNLDLAPLEDLLQYRVLFFNSIGVVEGDGFAKLREYVRRGGTLITLGTPCGEDPCLFPAQTVGVLNPQSWRVMAKFAWDYVKLYARMPRQLPHRLCAYTMEGMYPAMLMTRHAVRTGLWLHDELPGDEAAGTASPERSTALARPRGVGRLWASRLVTLVRPTGKVRTLLSHRGRMAGYEVDYEAGRSVFIGTLLGASFDSPGYYLDDVGRVSSVSRWLGRRLAAWGLPPLTSPTSGVEIVLRRGDAGHILFAINRREATHVAAALPADWPATPFSDQFAGGASRASMEGGQLKLDLAAHDVLVLGWWPA